MKAVSCNPRNAGHRNKWQRKLKMSPCLERGHELVLGPFRAEKTQVTKKQKLCIGRS